MENIALLRGLGFTAYEAKAYLALSQLGEASAKKIAEKSGLPKNKVYEVLSSLEEKEKVISVPVSPRTYRISSVDSLVDDISTKKEEILALESACQLFVDDVIKRRKIDDSKEFFWILKTKKAIEQKLRFNNKNVRKEILSCHTFSREFPVGVREIEKAVQRKVDVKVLTPVDKQNKKRIEEWVSVGATIRKVNKYPGALRFTIFDGKAVRLTIGDPEASTKEDFRTLWIESPSFAALLRDQFMSMWEESKEI
jgi:HTH-type transcriptional regulator, sugar sensing transcriptional regulator